MQQRHNHKRGFSLIEAAIVLAVVGLVVAGIWWAAGSVIERWKVNSLTTALLQIDQKARELFPKQMWPSEPGGSTSITNTLIQSGGVPKDMVLNYSPPVIANIISPKGNITMNLLYPPLTSTRLFYYHLRLIDKTETANLFLRTFITATQKTGVYDHCFCIRCIICNGSDNLSQWYGTWPPNCPKITGNEKLSIACYLKE